MRRAMTLVELLVVVGIIAVIAGLSLGVIMSARKRGYLAVCINNLRQLTQAVHMYEMDWGTVPIENRIKTPEGWWGEVQQILYPYVKNEAVFLCPADFTNGTMLYSDSGPGRKFIPIWRGKVWVKSYDYWINIVTVKNYGRGDPRLRPRSVLFECAWHSPHYRVNVIARYDGTIEVAPIGRYKVLRPEFEAGPPLEE